MNDTIAAVGSVTSAVKLRKTVMRTSSVTPSVVHTPTVINKGGCSYSLCFNREYIPVVKRAAAECGVNIKGIFIKQIVKGECVYNAVS